MPSLPKISDAEWEVMKVLWAEAPLTATAIIERLQARDPTWHPATVRTLINRLLGKRALTFSKQGRLYLYHPAVDQRTCAAAETDSFLARVFDGSLRPMLAQFAERRKLSAVELRELNRLLEAMEQ